MKKVSLNIANKRTAFLLLLSSAVIRLIGQMLAINVIGALTLVVDVYALSKLLDLDKRTRAISPFWLATCFAFSLPLERMVQRVLGYGLQQISAEGACRLLGGMFDKVSCHGVRIVIDTKDVLVDLPCSGARSFLMLLVFYCAVAAIGRFKPTLAILGFAVVLVAALLVNILRISVLAAGLSDPTLIGGLDVMAQPIHDIVGLSALFIGCFPIIIWLRIFYQVPTCIPRNLDHKIPPRLMNDAWWLEGKTPVKNSNTLFMGLSFALAAVVIISLPGRAIDVVQKDLAISLPVSLHGELGQRLDLSAQEQAYFTQFGGSAQKALYGDHSLMVVRTSAPLRHLHAPDECLRGLGMKVEYQGIYHAPLPTAVYKATDHQNQSYRIAVSFISGDHKRITTNVSEAIWHWMQDPAETWMAVQRISKWHVEASEVAGFDKAIMASLDIPDQSDPIILANFIGGEHD